MKEGKKNLDVFHLSEPHWRVALQFPGSARSLILSNTESSLVISRCFRISVIQLTSDCNVHTAICRCNYGVVFILSRWEVDQDYRRTLTK